MKLVLFLVISSLVYVNADCEAFIAWAPKLVANVSLDNSASYSFRASNAFATGFPGIGGIGFYQSYAVGASANVNDGWAKFDVLSARIQAGVKTPPVVALATFKAEADYKVVKKSDFDDQDKSDADANAGAYAAALMTIVEGLVEFEDVDGDRVYTPGKDNLVQLFTLGGLKSPWGKVCDPVTSGDLTTFNMSTTSLFGWSDFRFSFQVQFSNVIGKLSDGAIVTPASAKISYEVKNFKYKSDKKNSQLAIAVFTAAASANAKAGVSMSAKSDALALGDDVGYFSWDGDVSVQGSLQGASAKAKIKASGWLESNDTSNKNLLSSLNFYFTGRADAKVTVKQAFFSIDADQPSYIYWDPSIGTGPQPQETDSNKKGLSPGAIAGIVIGIVIVVGIAVAAAFVVLNRKKVPGAMSTPLKGASV